MRIRDCSRRGNVLLLLDPYLDSPHSAAKVVPADLALLRVEIDEGRDPTSSAVFGSYRDRTTAQLLCKLVLDEDSGTRIIDPVRPNPNRPGGAGKLCDNGKIEISVEVEIIRMESGPR
jgi:hypothetical protein